MRYLVALSIIAFCGLGCVNAKSRDLHLLVAYSRISVDDAQLGDTEVDSASGVRLGLGGSAMPVRQLQVNEDSGFRLGAQLGFSYYRKGFEVEDVGIPGFFTVETYADLIAVDIEAIVSWRQVLGRDGKGLFIEPGCGLGGTLGYVWLGDEYFFDGDPVSGTRDTYEDDTAVSYSLRPFLRLGYHGESILAGVEGGYRLTGLEFDEPFGSGYDDSYVGIFVSMRAPE